MVWLQPAPRPKWPNVISTVRALTGVQVALVMVCGNCSFGWPLAMAIFWVARYFGVAGESFAFFGAWAVGFAAITTYAYFVYRWSARADRRARTTIIIGTAVLVGCAAGAVPLLGGSVPETAQLVLLASAPSLLIQAIVLRCVYGREGRRWFDSSEAARMDRSA
jgi:hypothetical protein